MPPADEAQLDYHKVTEDAAEGIALALVHGARGWSVRRRLQRFEHGDWLLVDPSGRHVALEVSGLDGWDGGRRIKEKLAQVSRCSIPAARVACVIALAQPSAVVEEARAG